jgi:hypothetical protein
MEIAEYRARPEYVPDHYYDKIRGPSLWEIVSSMPIIVVVE